MSSEPSSKSQSTWAVYLTFAYAMSPVVIYVILELLFLQYRVGKEQSIQILQSIIQLDGFLIGFAGLVATLSLTGDTEKTRERSQNAAGLVIIIALLFVLSVIFSVYEMARLGDTLTPVSYLASGDLTGPMTFAIAGVIVLLFYAAGLIDIIKSKPKSK